MMWLWCVLALVVTGCEQKPVGRHYVEVAGEAAAPASAPAAQEEVKNSAGIPDMRTMTLPGNGGATQNKFTWDLPDGWEESPGEGMRLVSFHLKADPKAVDASIVDLSGAAGGLEANLRRWMGQIGVEAAAEDLERLMAQAPGLTIKGNLEGRVYDFSKIQEKAKPSAKSMVAVMVPLEASTLFVKMAGTVETVGKNKAAFLALASSIAVAAPAAEQSEPAADPHAGIDMNDPHAGMDMAAVNLPMPDPDKSGLSWALPKGWQAQGGHPMRLATFWSEATPEVECSMIILSGMAGGVEANLSRWIRQTGLEPSKDNIGTLTAKAQSLKTKGGWEAKVFDMNALGIAAAKPSMQVGMINFNGSTLFVKMTGPAADLDKNTEALKSLIQSLDKK